MSKKVIKITTKQLQTIINEEASRYKKVLELKRRKNEIISQLNEMYSPEEIEEAWPAFLGGKTPEEKAAAEKTSTDAMGVKYDADAKAWLDGLIQRNPKINAQIYQQTLTAQKQGAVTLALQRSKEMGSKPGHFVFPIKNGKLFTTYEQGNIIPSTGLGATGAGAGTMGNG